MSEPLYLSGDIIVQGSRDVARLNPTLRASERYAVEMALNPEPERDGSPEYHEPKYSTDDMGKLRETIKRRAKERVQAGSITFDELSAIVNAVLDRETDDILDGSIDE